MRVAVLGLGLMGIPIALRLQQQGFAVSGWNRGAEGRRRAEALGVSVESDCALSIAGTSHVILTLSDANAIQTVLFASDKINLFGKRVLQMGTIAPSESRALAERVSRAGGHYLEAPVLGSIPEARSGRLILMAGGSREQYDSCLPLMKALGDEPRRVGEVGQGAALKLAMNQLIASLTAGFSLSLGLVRAEGVEVEDFMALLRKSALYAPTFDKKLEKMLRHDYANPNFPLKHLIKDIELFQRVAAESGIDQSLPETMRQLFERGLASGHGDDDYCSLYEAINPEGG